MNTARLALVVTACCAWQPRMLAAQEEDPYEVPADPSSVVDAVPAPAPPTEVEAPPVQPQPTEPPPLTMDATPPEPQAASPENDVLDLAAYGSPEWRRLWILTAATALPSLLLLAVPVVGPVAYVGSRLAVPLFLTLPGDPVDGTGRKARARRFMLVDLVVHGTGVFTSLAGGVVLGGLATAAMMLSAIIFPFSVCLPFCLPYSPQVAERSSGSLGSMELLSLAGAPFVMALMGTGICLGSTCVAQAVTPLWVLWPSVDPAREPPKTSTAFPTVHDDAAGPELEVP